MVPRVRKTRLQNCKLESPNRVERESRRKVRKKLGGDSPPMDFGGQEKGTARRDRKGASEGS